MLDFHRQSVLCEVVVGVFSTNASTDHTSVEEHQGKRWCIKNENEDHLTEELPTIRIVEV